MQDLDQLINEYYKLGIDSIINYEEYNNILITAHSTRIEGSTLSFEEATELIQNRNTPGGKKIDFSLMALDHHDALNFMLEESKKDNRLSVKFIQEIASKVVRQTGEVRETVLGFVDSTKGEFRKGTARAGNRIFMNYQKIEPALNNLVAEIKGKFPEQKTYKDQLELSFFAHYELVNIHPFLDGNGRTSRLLMNYIQKKYDLPLGIVFSEDKPQYYQALESVYEKEDYRDFYDFMFGQYKKHLRNEIQKVKEAQEEKQEEEYRPRFRR